VDREYSKGFEGQGKEIVRIAAAFDYIDEITEIKWEIL